MAVVVAGVFLESVKTPEVKVSRLTTVTLPLPRGHPWEHSCTFELTAVLLISFL